ncbi:heat-shock protein, partial [Mammaliicoccus fleurettii]
TVTLPKKEQKEQPKSNIKID